jgi:hypothetical protein
MSEVGLTVAVLLGMCVAALFAMRDRAHAAPHPVLRWVRCPRYGRTAYVEFIERMRTGIVTRTVQRCPLRRPGEGCGERCTWEPTLHRAP